MITSWKTLSIGEFQKIWDVQQLHISEDEKIVKITAILAGMEEDEFMSMPLIDSRELIAQAGFLYTEPKTHRVSRTYKIGKRLYRLMRNAEELTTAQYINYQAIVGRPINEIIADLMAIVLVPEGKKYGEINTDEVVEEIRDGLNIEDALSIANFFTKSFERSMRRTLLFSDGMLKAAEMMGPKETREQMKALRLELKLIREALRSEYGYR